METRVWGSSDDLVGFNGELQGEVGCLGTDDREQGVLLMFSDGTVLEVKYCKRLPGIWGIDLLRRGDLFDKIDTCTDEDADPYSDVAHFKDGIKWAYAAKDYWEQVH